MKICFITYNIFSQGGVQRVVTNLSNELCENNKVDIICTVDNDKINPELYGLNIDKINVSFKIENLNIISKILRKIIKVVNNKTGVFNKRKLNNILKEFIFPKHLRRDLIEYLNEKNYDVIIGVEGYFSLLLGIISDELNAKTIGWEHNSFDAYLKIKGKRYYYNQDEMFKFAIPNLDKHIVLTQYDKMMYKSELGIESNVIYNPKSFSCKEVSDFSNKVFISVGRLERAKGFDLLIDSFNEFAKIDNEWTLNIIGEGNERKRLQRKIDDYKLNDRIFLLGAKNNIEEYYKNASIYLSSSRWEGLPLVLIEAMECGLPIISFDYPAAQEIISNNNGILVKSFDIKDYANKMHSLSSDSKKISFIGKNNRIEANKYSKDRILKEWIEVL